MNADYFQRLFAYHYALYRHVWDSIMTLTDEQFLQDIPYSQGSLRNQMVHIASVDRGWLTVLQEQPDVLPLKPEDFPTRAAVRTKYDQAERNMLEFVNSLSDADLEHQPKGFSESRALIMGHIVNHGTDHRGQILRILNDFGAPTFDQDIMIYLWETV